MVLTYRMEDPPFLAVLLETSVLLVVCSTGPSPRFPLPSSLLRTSLVAQWLRISLLMQGIWVQSLVWEDSTCCETTNPMRATTTDPDTRA